MRFFLPMVLMICIPHVCNRACVRCLLGTGELWCVHENVKFSVCEFVCKCRVCQQKRVIKIYGGAENIILHHANMSMVISILLNVSTFLPTIEKLMQIAEHVNRGSYADVGLSCDENRIA